MGVNYMQFLYPGLALTIAILASGFALLTGHSGAVFYLAPLGHTASSSEVIRLGVYLDAGRPINVVSGRITFPQDIITVSVQEAEDAVIDLWLEAPKVSVESGEVRFAGGTSQKLDEVDRALLFYIDVERLKEGFAELDFTDIQTLERDGRGTPLSATSRSYVVFANTSAGAVTGAGANAATATPVKTQADFDGDGVIAVDDLSILLSHLFGEYEATYDLNRDGSVGLGDLSTFFTVYGR